MKNLSNLNDSETNESTKDWQKIKEETDNLIIQIKRRHIIGAYDTSKHTIALLGNLVTHTFWTDANEIMNKIRIIGKLLINSLPHELAIGNVIRRVLYIIREEYMNAIRSLPLETIEKYHNDLQKSSNDKKLNNNNRNDSKTHQSVSLQTILSPGIATDLSIPIKELRQAVLEGIAEFTNEVDNLHGNIADQALEHIHSDEVILTFGESTTVEQFLITAFKKRSFKVIVVETYPSLNGHKTAKKLAGVGMDITVITDSAVFAMMSRVNKVVIPTCAVMANGGLIAHTGAHNIALSASQNAIPLVCVAGLFKLCPLYPHDLDILNELVSPAAIFNYKEIDKDTVDFLTVLNPVYDYVPPEYVDLFITNIGGHQPSYIYRLLAEYYCSDDYDL